MVVVLVLTILETEALHHALNARIPKTFAERFAASQSEPES